MVNTTEMGENMNPVLTKAKSLQEIQRIYSAAASECRFTDLMRNYIQNEEWKDTSSERVWGVLSKIADDIGAVLTDDIMNYTRNVVDINTCRIPMMVEHSSALCYDIRNVGVFFSQLPV